MCFSKNDDRGLRAAVQEERRSLSASIRQLEREQKKTEYQERYVFQTLKNQARSNRVNRADLRQLVFLRKRKACFEKCRTQLQSAALYMQQQQTTHEIHKHLRGCAKVLSRIGAASARLPDLQKTVLDFSRESQRLGILEEMLSDALEDASAELDDEEDEANALREIVESSGAMLEAEVEVHQGLPITILPSTFQHSYHDKSELDERMLHTNNSVMQVLPQNTREGMMLSTNKISQQHVAQKLQWTNCQNKSTSPQSARQICCDSPVIMPSRQRGGVSSPTGFYELLDRRVSALNR